MVFTLPYLIDENTPYTDKEYMYQVIIESEENSKVLIDWINDNYMKANPDKFHILLISSQNELNDNITTINIDNNISLNEGSEKLLGITIDNKLTFKIHVSNLCKKASQKLHALARVSQYMDLLQRIVIINSFVVSQFGYCPLEKDKSVTIHKRNVQILATGLYVVVNTIALEILKGVFS